MQKKPGRYLVSLLDPETPDEAWALEFFAENYDGHPSLIAASDVVKLLIAARRKGIRAAVSIVDDKLAELREAEDDDDTDYRVNRHHQDALEDVFEPMLSLLL